ncbi:MAG: L,D-transpeptidase family protein [Bauldia sp.]
MNVRQVGLSIHRTALRVAVGAFVATTLCGTALAVDDDDPIAAVLRLRAGQWSTGFDTGAAGAPKIIGTTPIFSRETTAGIELAIQRYSEIVAEGGWPEIPEGQNLKLGAKGPAVEALREWLITSGDLSPTAGVSEVFDSYVDAAVRRFQTRHGIPSDGVVGPTSTAAMNITAAARLGQLVKNRDRLNAAMAKLPERFVMVNVPGAQVEGVEGGRVTTRHTAVVGRIDRPTPMLTSKISEVNFNPFWTVPPSLIKRDLIPLMQKNPNYIAEEHIRVYDKKGKEISPNQINWNTDQATQYLFRQDPGDWNSLGSVRINFPSPYGVYMHDTPSKGLFNEEFRFDSSGCVRVQNIQQLITWLLRDNAGWNRARVDGMFTNNQRLDVKLASPVPLYFAYISAWAQQDGVVHFRDDIYNQDGLQVANR